MLLSFIMYNEPGEHTWWSFYDTTDAALPVCGVYVFVKPMQAEYSSAPACCLSYWTLPRCIKAPCRKLTSAAALWVGVIYEAMKHWCCRASLPVEFDLTQCLRYFGCADTVKSSERRTAISLQISTHKSQEKSHQVM